MFISLRTHNLWLECSRLGWRNAVGHTAGRSNPAQLKYKLSTITAYSTGGNVAQTELSWAAEEEVPRLSPLLPCSEGITPPKVLPHSACSSRVDSSEGGGTTRKEIQRTEISYYWKYFTQSRRLCIISYKSPIQTELMEKYTSKQPFRPRPLDSHTKKCTNINYMKTVQFTAWKDRVAQVFQEGCGNVDFFF